MRKIINYCKLSIVIVILMCLMCPAIHVSAAEWDTYDYSRFNNSTYVYDIGSNFKNIDLNQYNNTLSQMRDKYGITYAFIVVNDYGSAMDELADYIWYNAGYDDDYISAVISSKSRDLYVYTYGKGIKIMNDGYVNGMVATLTASLSNNDYDGALESFIDLAGKMTDSYINDTASVTDRFGTVIYATDTGSASVGKTGTDVGQIVLVGIVGGIIFAIILTSIELGKHKPVRKATNADFYVQDENVKMDAVRDVYLRSHETRTRIQSNNSGGGGRSGGSTFSGSSGRSHGGGGGKF